MSTTANLLVSFGYFTIGLLILTYEYRKYLIKGVLSHHIFLIFYFIYIILPSIIIHFILALNEDISTNVLFFDKILVNIDLTQSITLFLLNILFLSAFYLTLIHLNYRWNGAPYSIRQIIFRHQILWISVGIGAIICLSFFWSLGDSFSERYARLILFRALEIEEERNFFTSNAFTITQTFAWICAGIFFSYYANKNRTAAFLALFFCLIFAFLQGSRRGFIFPVLIVFFAAGIYNNHFNIRSILIFSALAVPWIAIGKEFLGSFAYSNEPYSFDNVYNSYTEAIMRAACDIGITQVQSYAVLQHFEWSFRLGIDHILSVLRRIPEGSLGFGDIFPERLVRITTRKFMSEDDLDIPPGLLGASWLDFPFLGAVGWGVASALACWAVEKVRNRYINTPESATLIALIMTVVAMPINTGSFDFTFSVDIILLALVIFISVKQRNIRHFAKSS